MPLPLPSSLSPSKVASFKDCALAFRYSAIDRLPEPPSPAAAKGTLVHRALELLFAEEAPPARTLEMAMAKLDRAWVEVIEHDDEYTDLELDDAEAFRADAADRVRRYFDLEDPTTINPIGLELRLEATLGSLRLAGIIDRLELDADGELVVTDYKTGRAPGERYEQGKLGGVHFYALLCEQMLGRRPARIQLLYLSDPPVAIVATPSDQSIKGMANRASAIWTAVERACERDDFRPRPGRLCDWCAFKAHCPAWGGEMVTAAAAG
ncbi:MAG TPA: PD-(D/E)XK nuclease family protein [Acidimicrobiales bacterium]|nr:PD-(D/E)XK nuclease family protein [Acidimicrobiales bacterium]